MKIKHGAIVAMIIFGSAAFAESIYDAMAVQIQKVFQDDSGLLLAEAMIDASNMDSELDSALTVAPRAVLGEPVDSQRFEDGALNAEQGIAQMMVHLDRARKYARNARAKIERGLELGGASESITGSALANIEKYGLNVSTYRELFDIMRISLAALEESLSSQDVGERLSATGLYRKQLIDLRTLLNGAPVASGA